MSEWFPEALRRVNEGHRQEGEAGRKTEEDNRAAVEAVLKETAAIIKEGGHHAGHQGGRRSLTFTVRPKDGEIMFEPRLTFAFFGPEVLVMWEGAFQGFPTTPHNWIRPFSRERAEDEVFAFVRAALPSRAAAKLARGRGFP